MQLSSQRSISDPTGTSFLFCPLSAHVCTYPTWLQCLSRTSSNSHSSLKPPLSSHRQTVQLGAQCFHANSDGWLIPRLSPFQATCPTYIPSDCELLPGTCYKTSAYITTQQGVVANFLIHEDSVPFCTHTHTHKHVSVLFCNSTVNPMKTDPASTFLAFLIKLSQGITINPY